MPKSKEFIDDSDSDYEQPKKKKKAEEKKAAKPEKASGGGDDNMMQLSRMRFVSVSEFKGKKLVNIREYYDADGEMKPGRKGISLSVEQWDNLKKHMDEIDSQLKG